MKSLLLALCLATSVAFAASDEWQVLSAKDNAVLALGRHSILKDGKFVAIIRIIWKSGTMLAPDEKTFIEYSEALVTGSCFSRESKITADVHFSEPNKVKVPELNNLWANCSEMKKPEEGDAEGIVLEAVCPPLKTV